jgi:tetratricopeptide (TPR) repeat protein
MRLRKKLILAVSLLLILLIGTLFFACGKNGPADLRDRVSLLFGRVFPGTPSIDPYYLAGTGENREYLRELHLLLAARPEAGEERFALIREIANTYARLEEFPLLVNFLSRRVSDPGDGPYHTYYLFMIAYAYIRMDAYPVAALYFDIIIKNYPDLRVMDQSIHLACLKELINLVENNEQQVRYYQELISRFSDQIDLGEAYFMLAQACEKIGDWNGAIQAYTQYLPYQGTIIPNFPRADNYAKQLVDFNNSPKDWTFENLPSLVRAIKTAIDTGSSSRLWSYRAKVNFFARSWEQEETDDSGMAEFNLSDFMRNSRIRYADTLDSGSNANESYLRTWGWSQYISTWYLYFRKIYFPLDPEIHGRWEWAGVYYGEKF